jgi:PAS domain S-box-containing protein
VLALDAVLNKKDYSFRTTFLPIVFGNGKPGAALIFENQTEFKETNRLIQQLESRYQALIEDQIEYVIRFLPNGTITYVNDAYCRDVGRDRESLQGFPFHPFIPDDDKEKVQRHFASLTRDNPVAIIEHRAIMANGQVRWQRWKDRALFDKRGKVIEYQSMGIDITDFRLAQEKLRTSYEHLEDLIAMRTQELQDINKQLYLEIAQRVVVEQKLKMTQFAMDNSADLIIWFDRAGKILYANAWASEALGYPQESLVSRSWDDLLPPGDSMEWESIWEACAQVTHNPRELRFARSDGSAIPVDVLLNRLLFNGNEYCCAFIRDITERKKIMEALRESEEQLKNFMWRLPIGLYRKEHTGALIFANPFLGRMFGHETTESLKEVHGNDLYVDPRMRKELDEEVRRTRSVVQGTVEMKKKSGDHFWAQLFEIGTFDEKGALRYIDGVLEDITEKTKAEEGLKNARRTLQFLNQVTLREITNELFLLRGYLDFAIENSMGEERECLGKIDRSATHIQRNITFGNRYQNIGARSPEWIRLQDSFFFAVSHLDLEHIALHASIGNLAIWADPHIELVFSILLEDSLLFGGGVKNISLRTEEQVGFLRLIYEDDGGGIPLEHKNLIFERDFNQENLPGLYLVREILSITGITIRETGIPRRGARFEISIPREGYKMLNNSYGREPFPPSSSVSNGL